MDSAPDELKSVLLCSGEPVIREQIAHVHLYLFECKPVVDGCDRCVYSKPLPGRYVNAYLNLPRGFGDQIPEEFTSATGHFEYALKTFNSIPSGFVVFNSKT